MPTFFKEEQRFDQWWMVLIVLISTVPVMVMMTYGFIIQVVMGSTWGTKPLDDVGLTLAMLLTWVVCGGIMAIMFSSRLYTEVRDKAIFYRFPIFMLRTRRLDMQSIASWEVKAYGFMEYGGYGVRKTFTKGTAYIVKGRYGLFLTLSNGKKVMLGTQKPEEMKQAVQREWDRFYAKE